MSFWDDLFEAFGGPSEGGFGVLDFIVNVFQGEFNQLRGILGGITGLVTGLLSKVGGFFSFLWDHFFSSIFLRVFHAIRDLTVWLETHIGPIIEWLQRAQRYILNLYNRYVRPMLVMIQRIRQVLTILRALHIKWAQDLDNILAHVQSDINAVFLKITGTINAVIDVLNIVTDPARLLRHPTLVLSVRRSILALIRQITGLPPGMFFPSRSANAPLGTKAPGNNFDPLDPLQNPPPSYYMSIPNNVPSFALFPSGQEVPDDVGDDVEPLDFFATAWDSISDCPDGVLCFMQVTQDAMRSEVNG